MTEIYDLIVVGGGPAGLSAAINGASELEKVLLIDSGKKTSSNQYERQLGGQAIGSSAIENYAGFPGGITGCDLMGLFEQQAQVLGTHIVCPEHVDKLELLENDLKQIRTREGSIFLARTVILANGLSYRKLRVSGVDDLLGKGVLYGAPTFNPKRLGKCTVCVVGAANSAGQAVQHLAESSDIQIKVLVRGTGGLQKAMSRYLIDRIEACNNVEVLHDVEVGKVHGIDRLEEVLLKCGNGSEFVVPANHLFIFIGAEPKTNWLNDAVAMDDRHFVLSGADLPGLYMENRPLFHQTSMPGVFVAGDIRHRSIKRVAAAVGEGAGAVSNVHRYLSRVREQTT